MSGPRISARGLFLATKSACKNYAPKCQPPPPKIGLDYVRISFSQDNGNTWHYISNSSCTQDIRTINIQDPEKGSHRGPCGDRWNTSQCTQQVSKITPLKNSVDIQVGCCQYAQYGLFISHASPKFPLTMYWGGTKETGTYSLIPVKQSTVDTKFLYQDTPYYMSGYVVDDGEARYVGPGGEDEDGQAHLFINGKNPSTWVKFTKVDKPADC